MKSVGVIIGRFQVPDLHDGHGHLFRYVLDNHDDVLVIVGSNDGPRNDRYPLPFKAVRDLILDFDKKIEVLPLADMPSDKQWSSTIDHLISSLYPMRRVILYGSRDSFVAHYCGKFEAIDLKFHSITSGSEVREEIKKTIVNSSDFRRGAIYSAMNLPPRTFMAVDIGVLKFLEDGSPQILLGKKSGADLWRLPGGFVDFTDESLEVAAIRELFEETGLRPEGSFRYQGSFTIQDWRQTKTTRILTSLFMVAHTYGIPKAGDDLAEVDFKNLGDFSDPLDHVVEEHHLLVGVLRNNYKKYIAGGL